MKGCVLGLTCEPGCKQTLRMSIYLGDVVKVPEHVVLLGLQASFKVPPDNGDVVNNQLQTTRGQSCGYNTGQGPINTSLQHVGNHKLYTQHEHQ